MSFDLQAWMQARQAGLETRLDAWLQPSPASAARHPAPERLWQAMRYAVLDGGKRLRPLLVGAAFEDLTLAPLAERDLAWPEAVWRSAAALELIHAYSLVHDDLPCMDNDLLRRGKPTAHVAWGEASALLAGDALQALAFEWLTPAPACIALPLQAQLIGLLARASGAAGMAGGQAIDLQSVGCQLDEPSLREMHSLKTGALIAASVRMGAVCAGPDWADSASLNAFGAALGLAFQVVDDILDVVGDTATLGKTAGKDAAADKPTYVSLMGLAGAQAHAAHLLQQGLHALDTLPGSGAAPRLRAMAHQLVERAL